MTSSSHRAPLANAAGLGAASGLRTFGALGALALRGRWGRRGRTAALVAAVGEIGFDKLPMVPPRSDAPSLAGRAVTGAVAGRRIAGAQGAGVGAACALATAYGSERLRAMVRQRTGVPDALLGAVEDALAIGSAVVVVPSAPPQGVPSAPPQAADRAGDRTLENGDSPETEGTEDLSGRSRGRAVVRGLAAAAVGTAAMTSVQVAYLKLSGGSSSSAPADVGQRIIKGVSGRKVPRKHHDALNQSMHMLYGTAWGFPFGLVLGSLSRRPPATASGIALGLSAWVASLVQLPALDLAPPPWQQPPASLATDLAFHLVYGTATAAVYQALDV